MIRISFFIMMLVWESLLFLTAQNSQDVAVIPKPNAVSLHTGRFEVNNNTIIRYSDDALSEVVKIVQTTLKIQAEKGTFANEVQLKSNSIYLRIDSGYCDEGYTLEVVTPNIICKASTPAGIFYATQSLMQLVKPDNTIPNLTINDKPKYAWRGFMLDESRHFMGKETVKQYLDLMARLKMNRFHWHLTDEPGWRIEIKRYPRLTEIGAQGNWSDSHAPASFYTQEEIREIVEYARQRNIMVIPEIDMPGHATAATKAYPELSGGGEGRWQGFTFNPAKESTYEFIDNVLAEIAELFPAPYLHIGADEVHFGNQSWFTDPEIQQFIKENELTNEVGLEHYFVRRVCETVHRKGKKMIGWDEVIRAGVTPDKAVVMWWRHDKPEVLTEALSAGFDVVLCPRIPCYFDFVQHDTHKTGRRWAGQFNRLETVYSFPQQVGKLTGSHTSHILGMQANVWTERVADKKRLDFLVFPRLMAIAESAWSDPGAQDYPAFEDRVKIFLPYLDRLGIYYFNLFAPDTTPEPYGPDRQDVIGEG